MNEFWQALLDECTAFIEWATQVTKAATATIQQSDDAGAVGGVGNDTLLAEVAAADNTHAAKKGSANPHHITADLAGGYAKSYVDQGVTNRLIWSNLNVSQYGDLTSADLGIVGSGLTLRFLTPQPIYLAGVHATLPAQDFPLTASKTYYVYIQLKNNAVNYLLSTTKLPESTLVMLIGRVVSGTSSLTSIQIGRVTRLGTNRVSTVPLGSCIPGTTGQVTETVKLAAGWRG